MNKDDSNELTVKSIDYITSVVKSFVGAVPIVGPFLCEVAGTLIPNQRIERLSKFAEKLADRFEGLQEDVLRSKLTDENFTDLLEESIRQAARSTSDERRAYIASLLANGVRSEDISYIESKHVLRLLGELNDIEIIILRAYYESHSTREIEFRNKHKDILTPITVPLGATQEKRDKATLQESYKIHMERLGLLRVKYRMDNNTRMPEFDRDRGLKKEGYEISQLGILLIRQINDRTPKK